MRYEVSHAIGISGQAWRSRNEDFLWPENPENYGSLFIVNDGTGSSKGGHIASAMAGEVFGEFFDLEPYTHDKDWEHHIGRAVRYVKKEFVDAVSEDPEKKEMATTTALLHVNDEGAYLAWMGDSRIYHFRQGEILHQTRDHSLVNLMLDQGLITEEEGRVHPLGSIISRVLQSEGPVLEADVMVIRDLEPGDVFLLCTDGVLEAWEDESLVGLSAASLNPKEAAGILEEECAARCYDNYSFFWLEIGEAEAGG